MSTLLNFVTVRNPRKPSKRELDDGFIRYDANLNAELVTAVAQARAAGADADRVRELVAGYVRTEDYLDDVETLTGQLAGLDEWVDWLPPVAATLTWADVDAWRADHQLEVGPETRRRLWDNLVAGTYGGGRPEVREWVVWALRALALDDRSGDRHDDADASRVARATVLIPSGGHGTLDREVVPEPPPPPPPDDTAEKLLLLGKLEAAYADLTDAVTEHVERARIADVAPPTVAVVGADGCMETVPEDEPSEERQVRSATVADIAGKLGKETLEQLDRLGVGRDLRAAHALQRISQEAERVGRSIGRAARATRPVVQVGGAFWTRRSPGEAAAPEGERAPAPDTHAELYGMQSRMDRSYAKYFGDRFDPDKPENDPSKCRIRPLGIGDFRRVEQRICCYEPGEVAHIENVLKGETKERTTRHLLSTERFTSTVTEEETTTERDSQTTNRFELQKEASKVVESDLSFELGVNLAAQYGPVKITADTKFAASLSVTESDKSAARYAQEVTDRALDRVVRKVTEERATRTTEEFEETNLHRLQAEDDHTVGLYRWVDKVYEAKVVNYGKRLMFEFLVPEPAAFHLHASVTEPAESTVTIHKPVDPRSDDTMTEFKRAPLTSYASITEANYGLWAAAYDVEVDPPPAYTVTITKAYHREGMDHNTQFADSKNDLKLPEGYEATSFGSAFGLHSEVHDGGPNWVTIVIGRRSTFRTSGGSFSGSLDLEDDVIPVVLMGRTRFYAINIEVDCRRTPERFATWQLKTYDAILSAYEEKLAAYETALAEAKSRGGVEIRGTNPALNRQIEQTELEKSCIRLLTRCAKLPSEAMKDKQECDYPEFDCCEAIRDGSVVQFFEQLFEWRIMTYVFYPYFWGRKCNWMTIYTLDDVDPLFLTFLKAGFARVVVPVRPAYEQAALRYLADGVIWDGGTAPGVDDPMYVAIENEFKEPDGVVDASTPPWKITVPTSLVVLQCESGCAPGTGLPCDCPPEDSDEDDGGDGDDDGDDG
ncbi:MAG TPA: hypothetical protein VGJ44_28335 [Kribbellaceae bacterium]